MVFSLGALGLGVIEGLAESTDEGLKKGFERIREEIDSTAETQVKREEKAIDAVNKDTKEVMEKLRAAQSVLGGVNDPKSAGRAAALLKQVGSVDDFDAIIKSIKTFKESGDAGAEYDFTRYFDSQSDLPGVNLADAARNYVLGITPPIAQIGEVQKRGGGIADMFNINIADRARAKAEAELASLGLTTPKVTEIDLPDIKFKAEAFKLDRMDPAEELKYLENKMLDVDTPSDRVSFYSTRAKELASRLGVDTELENLTRQYNLALSRGALGKEDAEKLLAEIQATTKQKNKFDILSSGDPIKLKEFELQQAMEARDTDKANEIRKELIAMGAMTPKQFTDVLEAQIQAGALAGEDTTAVQNTLSAYNNTLQEIQQTLTPESLPTIQGQGKVRNEIYEAIYDEMRNMPEFSDVAITVTSDGTPIADFDKLTTEKKLEVSAYIAKRAPEIAKMFADLEPKNGDAQFVYRMLTKGVTLDDQSTAAKVAENAVTQTETATVEGVVADPVAATGVGDASEDEVSLVKQKIITDFGPNPPNANSLRGIVDSIASTMRSRGTATSVDDIVVEVTEALSIGYGDEVVQSLRDNIRQEAEKAFATPPVTEETTPEIGFGAEGAGAQSRQDITVTRMGKPKTYRQVGTDFYEVDQETGTLSNLPVGTNSALYDQLLSLTPEGQADRDEQAQQAASVETLSDFEVKMNRLKPDIIFNAGAPERLRIPYRRVGDQFFRINDDGSLSKSPADNIRTRQLLESMAGETETATSASSEPASRFSVEDAAETQFRNRDDLTTGQEFPGRPTARSDQTIPADTKTMAGTATERTTTDKGGPFQPPKDVKAASTDFLIAELVNNRMTSETAEELERRIEADPSGKLALRIAKIVERAEKARAE